jgi:electron transfer flavoprotein beta subunit
VRLKKLLGGRVRALTVGPLRCSEVLYQAVAKGADDAIRIDCDTDDPMTVARLVAAYLRQNPFDLVLTGVESRDEMASAVAPALAGLLDRPFATSVTAISAGDDGRLIADKEMGGGHLQRLALRLPAVLAVQSGICRLTYAPTARVLQARRMPPRSLQPASLGVDTARTSFLEVRPPVREPTAEMLGGRPSEIAAALLDRIENALHG